jgi:flagellar protein FlgJ
MDNVDKFIVDNLPHAIKASIKTGLHPLFMLPQAALETGWGSKVPVNNMFGIKAYGKSYGGWDGKSNSGNISTQEDFGGGLQNVKDKFRAYKTKKDSFIDYAGLIKNKYIKAFNSTDIKSYATYIKQGGYATDSQYVDKVISVHNKIKARIPMLYGDFMKKYDIRLSGSVLLLLLSSFMLYTLIKNYGFKNLFKIK